jgi:2-dehydro-3-deoxyphosphogluconate aldolase/(4S)-4-hydroxy-2-oxoglutarate aldolase
MTHSPREAAVSLSLSLSSVADAGVIAVLRAPSAAAAVQAVDALVRGGVTGVEITYSTPDAEAAIAEVADRHGDAVLLGAGTLTRPEQAERAVAAGARFLVSPGTEPELAKAMRATGALVMLGALTPSEVMAASALGADVVKIFPASLGGPAYLRSLRGPFPDIPLMPTGGVNSDNLAEWLRAGAVAVGAGSELCGPAAMNAGNWEVITDSARAFVAALAAARAAA